MQLAVIGDVGGQHTALMAELVRLGLDPATLALPDSLTVIQVGDLIHRGPDSDAVVALVDQIIDANAGRWVQLAGNHESLYVTQPSFGWDETVTDATIATLQRWWADGTMQLAAGYDTDRGGLLVTHAGLTHGCWAALGRPDDACATAAAINAGRYDETSPAWEQGRMLTGTTNLSAGVVWAEAGKELIASWLGADETLGFDQVHGHSTAYWWNRNTWVPAGLDTVLGERAHLDRAARHVRVELDGQVIWGVDPAHGRDAARQWSSLTLFTASM